MAKKRKRNTVAKAVAKAKKPTDADENKTLTPLEMRFCTFCTSAASATEAGIKAGMSEASARTLASRMLKKVHIRKEIQNQLDDIASDMIISKKAAIAVCWQRFMGDISDSTRVNLDGQEYIAFDEDMPNTKAVKKAKVRNEVDENGNISTFYTDIELHDPDKSLKAIRDMLGWDKAQEISMPGFEALLAMAAPGIGKV